MAVTRRPYRQGNALFYVHNNGCMLDPSAPSPCPPPLSPLLPRIIDLTQRNVCSRSRTMDVSVGVPIHYAKEKPPINVVGDVGGRIAIMVVCMRRLIPFVWHK